MVNRLVDASSKPINAHWFIINFNAMLLVKLKVHNLLLLVFCIILEPTNIMNSAKIVAYSSVVENNRSDNF